MGVSHHNKVQFSLTGGAHGLPVMLFQSPMDCLGTCKTDLQEGDAPKWAVSVNKSVFMKKKI